ncbi:hypothetical protein, partial [Ralstonia pseudosolanacearum]
RRVLFETVNEWGDGERACSMQRWRSVWDIASMQPERFLWCKKIGVICDIFVVNGVDGHGFDNVFM